VVFCKLFKEPVFELLRWPEMGLIDNISQLFFFRIPHMIQQVSKVGVMQSIHSKIIVFGFFV